MIRTYGLIRLSSQVAALRGPGMLRRIRPGRTAELGIRLNSLRGDEGSARHVTIISRRACLLAYGACRTIPRYTIA